MSVKKINNLKFIDDILPVLEALGLTVGITMNEIRYWTIGDIRYTMDIESRPMDIIRIRIERSNTDDIYRRFTDDKFTETLGCHFNINITQTRYFIKRGKFLFSYYRRFYPLSNVCRYCNDKCLMSSKNLNKHNKSNQHKKSLQRLAIEISQTCKLNTDCVSNILSFL